MNKLQVFQGKIDPIELSDSGLITEEELLSTKLLNFDREGFELDPILVKMIERSGNRLWSSNVYAKESHQENGWKAVAIPWVNEVGLEPFNIFVDHSYQLQIPHITGELRHKISTLLPKNPRLVLLLQLRFKIGLDICIDYYTGGSFVEVLHIEYDFLSYSKYMSYRKTLIQIINNAIQVADMDKVVDNIIEHHEKKTPIYELDKLKMDWLGLNMLSTAWHGHKNINPF